MKKKKIFFQDYVITLCNKKKNPRKIHKICVQLKNFYFNILLILKRNSFKRKGKKMSELEITTISLNEEAFIKKLPGNLLVREAYLQPLILISIARLGYSFKLPEKKIIENVNYIGLYIKNETKDFFKKFKLGMGSHVLELNYKDVDIWETQFEEGNQMYILKDKKNSTFYLMHVSFLPKFHKNVMDFALDKYNQMSIVEYKNTFHEFEKKILLRNARKKMFIFCSENSLQCGYENDVLAKKVHGKSKPLLIVLEHQEFLNDMKWHDDSMIYFGNCSIYNEEGIGHVKLMTESKMQWVRNKEKVVVMKEKEETIEKEKDLFAYLNISSPIEKIRPNELFKQICKNSPHCVFNVTSEKGIYYNLPDLDKIYDEKTLLDSVHAFR